MIDSLSLPHKLCKILKRLDKYSLLTAFSTLALQYQFLRISEFFSTAHSPHLISNLYVFTGGLILFSMVLIYNSDHLWTQKQTYPHKRATRHTFAIMLSGLGIIIWFVMGWSIWNLSSIFYGLGAVILSVTHLFVFHSPMGKLGKLFLLKEVSVSTITVVGLSLPIVFLGDSLEKKLLNVVEVSVLFMVVLNSVLFYSWTRYYEDRSQKVKSLFHYLTFSQAKRVFLSLIFFSLIAQLMILNNSDFIHPHQSGIWYFPAVTVVQGLLVRGVRDAISSMEEYRLVSKMIFLLLLPFFLW